MRETLNYILQYPLFLLILAGIFAILALLFLPSYWEKRKSRKYQEQWDLGYGWAALQILHHGHDVRAYLRLVTDSSGFSQGVHAAMVEIESYLSRADNATVSDDE